MDMGASNSRSLSVDVVHDQRVLTTVRHNDHHGTCDTSVNLASVHAVDSVGLQKTTDTTGAYDEFCLVSPINEF